MAEREVTPDQVASSCLKRGWADADFTVETYRPLAGSRRTRHGGHRFVRVFRGRQRYFGKVGRGMAGFAVACKEAAIANLVHSADPSLTLHGELFEDFSAGGDAYVLLFEFRELRKDVPERLGTEHARRLARHLFSLHQLGVIAQKKLAAFQADGMLPPCQSVRQETLLKLAEMRRSVDKRLVLDSPYYRIVGKLAEWLADHNARHISGFDDTGLRTWYLLHGDLHPYNAFVTAENDLLLCDWQSAKLGAREQDLGNMINWLNEDVGEELIGHYAEMAQLDRGRLQARCDFYSANLQILGAIYGLVSLSMTGDDEGADMCFANFRQVIGRYRRFDGLAARYQALWTG